MQFSAQNRLRFAFATFMGVARMVLGAKNVERTTTGFFDVDDFVSRVGGPVESP